MREFAEELYSPQRINHIAHFAAFSATTCHLIHTPRLSLYLLRFSWPQGNANAAVRDNAIFHASMTASEVDMPDVTIKTMALVNERFTLGHY